MKIQRSILMLGIFVLSAFISPDDSREILLWPNGAPGSEGRVTAEKVRIFEATGDHVISNVHKPSITPFLPARDKSSGVAVIIAPGGGHRELWIDHEGYNIAKKLAEHGIASFVLKYRLAKEDNSPYTIEEHEVADMKRAIRLIRTRAKEWGIDTARIGVMGFSAGGEVAARCAMKSDSGNKSAIDVIDRENSRPAFQALIYPGGSENFEASKTSPPLFLLGGYGDRADIAEGLAEVYLKYKKAGIPCEIHIYSGGNHGFGVRATNKGALAVWPERFIEWLGESGLTDKR